MSSSAETERAVEAIRNANSILITAGAGLGVDSGLPDFRGDRGFWNVYPPYERRGFSFADLANPAWFRNDLPFAWGFYGHRLHRYRETVPHDGFQLLLRWANRCEDGFFAVTSNVDGQFQKAGFPEDRIVEIHGSIHHLQCVDGCGIGILDGEEYSVEVNEATMRAAVPVPTCPRCGGPLRPNILMFDDREWDSSRTDRQSARYQRWLRHLHERRGDRVNLVVVECGAGTALPAIRAESERRAREFGGALIRINRYDPDVPGAEVVGPLFIGLRGGALDVLRRIDLAQES